jgi:EAL domain-containing protein (putative c-di-GMP-specific phosphodiesterase class I)
MAEGVETEEVTAILKGYECNLVQGEYYHHYMSEHDIAQLLNNTPM